MDLDNTTLMVVAAVVMVLAVLALTALIGGGLFAHFNDPDRPLYATSRQLDAGLPAVNGTLIVKSPCVSKA